MNKTNVPESVPEACVPKSSVAGPPSGLVELLERMGSTMEDMPPQVRKATAFVLDNPDEVGFATVRKLADLAGVHPNTLIRMARAVGFDGFEDFRDEFRNDMRSRRSFHDRAVSLQRISSGDGLPALYTEIAGVALMNVERMFASTAATMLRVIADRIVSSRRTYVIGVGANYALVHNFAYLAGMALDNVVAVPAGGHVPMDGIVKAGPLDVVVAMTFAPYRVEVVEATAAARRQGALTVAITDSHRSPIASGADHVILAPSATPQFFPSTLAASAALETLVSFIVADAPPEVVEDIDRMHQRRYDLGVYWRNGDGRG